MKKQTYSAQIASLLLISLLFANISYSQNKLDGFSINPKLGWFNWAEDISGVIVGVEANALKRDMIFSIAYYNAEDFVIQIGTESPVASYNQFDLLFGKYIDWKIFRFQYQGGLGALWGVYPGDIINYSSGGLSISGDIHEEVSYFTVGVPLKLGFKIMPTRFTSIGLDFQANLNPKNSLYMLMLSIELGKIRN